MEETGKACPTTLISDAPAKEDAFKSHDRVARAIVDLVKNEPGGLTIGVEGAWGTGKSTIIRFVKDGLSSDPNVAFVLFDAWAHQGDPLRRSFLERLIGVINNNSWVDKERWKNVLDELARRIHKSSTTTTPTLTKEGRWLAASVLLIPVGAAILEPLIEAGPRIWPDGLWGFFLQVFTWLSALGLSFAPFAVALFLMRNRGEGKPFWGLFSDEQTTREDSESTEDPEPTSLEFSKRFTELLDEALKEKNRKVVIVVDNLDRIPQEVATSMWATMRTFLEHGEYQRPEWFSRIWVIVPYAIESLKKTAGTYSEGDTIFAFIDKVFQIHFYVSPPVLSDWKEYLGAHVKTAFPKHNDETEIHRIYRTWTQNAVRPEQPTPRDLVIFINDIGALHRQWQDTFPLSRMAYYCLIRRNHDVAKELLDGAIPAQRDKDLLGEDLADTVAALYFNREVKHAKQLLLKPPLTKQLASGNSVGLITLAKLHTGLFAVLERELKGILSDWLATETATIARAAKCILSDGVLSAAPQAEAQSIRSCLFDVCGKVEHWVPIDEMVSEGLAVTVVTNGAMAYAQTILLAIRGSYDRGEISKKPDFPDIANWLSFYIRFLKDIKSKGLLPGLDDVKQLLPGSQKEWVLAAQYFEDQDESRDLVSAAFPTFDPELLVGEYIRVVNNDTFSEPHLEALLLGIRTIKQQPDYSRVAQSIQNRLEENPATTASRAYCLFYGLWRMAEINPGAKAIEIAESANGHILHYYQVALGAREYFAASLLAYLMIVNRSQLGSDRVFQASQTGNESMMQFFNDAGKFPEIRDAFINVLKIDAPKGVFANFLDKAPNARRLLRDCALRMSDDKTITIVLSSDELFNIWKNLDEVESATNGQPVTLSKIIAALDQSKEFTLKLIKTSFELNNVRFYMATVLSRDNMTSELKIWAQHGLDGVGQDIWKVQLQNDGELVALLEIIRGKEKKIEVGIKYLDALCELADGIADGKGCGTRSQERWPMYFEPLKPDLRLSFGEKLIELVKRKKGNIHPQFFTIFGQEAFAKSVVNGDLDIVPQVLNEFVNARNASGLRRTVDLIRSNDDTLDGLGKSHNISEFKDRIREALMDKKGDECDGLFVEIATLLKITVEKSQAEED